MASKINTCDLYTCQVCLESLIDNSPRLLWCYHSFCQRCLQELVKGEEIECPTCRNVTVLGSGDVTKLSADFKIQQMKEHMQHLLGNKEAVCHLCRCNIAQHKCKECTHLLCVSCIEKHNTLDRFKSHNISPVCGIHSEGILSHICLKCVEVVCTLCILTNHTDHDSEIMDYSLGIQALQEMLEHWKEQVQSKLADIREIKETDETQINETNELKKNVEIMRDEYAKKLQETEKVLREIDKISDGVDQIKNSHTKAVDTVHVLFKRIRCLTLEDGSISLSQFKAMKLDVETELSKCVTSLVRFQPPVELAANLGFTYLCRSTIHWTNLKLVSCVHKVDSLELKEPVQLLSTDDDTALVVDTLLPCILKINKHGVKVSQYDISKEGGAIRGIQIYMDIIFVLKANRIDTFKTENPSVIDQVYTPTLNGTMSHMCVVNMTTVLIVSYGGSGDKVYTYNTLQNTTRVVIDSLEGTRHITAVRKLGKMRYLLSQSDAKHTISIYDDQFHLIRSVGGEGTADGNFKYPETTAVVPGGFLVADWDNHRVSLFSSDWEFIQHVLTNTEHNIQCPVGLSYRNGLLWISQCGYSSTRNGVKCFQLKE